MKRALLASAWALLLCFETAPSAAQPLGMKYSNVDLATVRIVNLRDIELIGIRTMKVEEQDPDAPGQRGRLSDGIPKLDREHPLYGAQLAAPDGGHGSGVVVDPAGIILTAEHVVGDAKILAVLAPGDPVPRLAKVIHKNEDEDVAFLATTRGFEHHVPIPDAPPELEVRMAVDAVGYPVFVDQSYPQSAHGVISGVTEAGALQLSMAVNGGNSGGPLVDAEERLLGMVVAGGRVTAGIQGIGIAVPMPIIQNEYRVVRGSTVLNKARQELLALPGHAQMASIVAELARLFEAPSSDELMARLPSDPARTKKQVSRALGGPAGKDPFWLLVGAAQLWNQSEQIRASKSGSVDEMRTFAANLCRHAVGFDDVLANHDLVRHINRWRPIVRRKQASAKEAASGDAPEVADRGLPTLLVGPHIGLRFPYQAGELGVDAWALLFGRYSLRATAALAGRLNHGEEGAHGWFEAELGATLLRWQGRDHIFDSRKARRRTSRYGDNVVTGSGWTSPHGGRAHYRHALIAEAGWYSGVLQLRPCAGGSCPRDFSDNPGRDQTEPIPASVTRRVHTLTAGLRLLSTLSADVDERHRRRLFELHAHLAIYAAGAGDTDELELVSGMIDTTPGRSLETKRLGFNIGFRWLPWLRNDAGFLVQAGLDPATRMPIVHAGVGFWPWVL